jgi:hypothetical protein
VAVFDSAQPDVSVDAPYDAGSKEDVNSMDGLLLDMKDALFNMNDALSLDGSSVLIDASSLDGMKDTTIIDAAQGVDGVGSDTRLPDAAGSCSGDLECTSGHCLNGKCVACKTNSHCNNAAGLPFCSAQSTCVSCASSGGANACTGNTSVCEPVSGRCVECADNASCTTENKAFCVANQCVGCGASGATSTTVDGGVLDGGILDGGILDGGNASVCKGATPMCAASGRCVECLHNSECTTDPDKAFCVQNMCQGCNATVSTSDAGVTNACPSATPLCQSATGLCVECLAKSDCHSASKGFCHQNACAACEDAGANACTGDTPVCMSSTSGTSKAGQCVGCADSGDCSGNFPICDTTTTFTCQACTSDAQCAAKGGGPGVCLADGHCATEAETVYVGTSGCHDETTAGTSSNPACSAQYGVSLATSTRPVVVIRGTLTAASTNVAVSFPFTIVGKNAAVLTAAAGGNCVSITEGEVYLRNLTLQGNSSSTAGVGIGISAAPPSGSTVTLHMDTCAVINNKGGGILLNDAAFDIKNTTITGNGSSSTGWGGISVQNPPSSGQTTINLVTIQDNQSLGLTCTGSIASNDAGSGVFATGNPGGNIIGTCGVSATACTTASTTCGAQSTPE